MGSRSPCEFVPSIRWRAYALLAFCCLESQQRKLLTGTELNQHVADIEQPAQRRSYYLSREDGQLRLGFIRVDAGGHGRWDRIAHKACSDMRKHLAVSSLCPLIDRHEFEICIITALPDKAQKIDALLRQQTQLSVPYRVIAITRLLNFLRPRPDSRDSFLSAPRQKNSLPAREQE